MKKVILSIDGMSCSACSSGLEKYLNKKEGVSATVNLVLQQASIEYNENLTIEDLEQYVKEAGFLSLGIYNPKIEQKNQNKKRGLIGLLVLAIILLYVSMGGMFNLPQISYINMEKYPINYCLCLLILTIPFLVYGFDIFRSGYKNILNKTPNMDTLVSIGVLASFLYSLTNMVLVILGNEELVHHLYFESSAIIIFFIKLGRYIDSKSKEKTKEAIKDLVKITPDYALLKVKDGEKRVTIDEVKKGNILICKAGDRVAVDGIITKGLAHLDESFITGESLPVKKSPKDTVVAGSINYDGYFEYKAEKIGKESTISEIVRLVVEASNTKAPIARVADRVSNFFVPTIIIISFITFIMYLLLGIGIDKAIIHFVNVLVVACPCALGLATPLAIVISEGRCAKEGILVKTSETLETACNINTVVFDKTGTLTNGNLKVSKVINYSNEKENKILQKVSSIENKSSHPISKAFINYMEGKKLISLEVSNFEEIPGIGLSATIENNKLYIGNSKIFEKIKIDNIYKNDEISLSNEGNSIVYVIKNKKVKALIGVKDTAREESKKVISKLYNLKKEVVMLTGDNELTANAIAKELGIKKVIANVMPKEKVSVIDDLIKQDKKVMMVGDGINDAPSLSKSTIGVSVSSGTDIANNSSDVILINNNLISIINLIEISKKTIRIIKQNLFWAFFYNLCMIPLAVGLLTSFGLDMNPMFGGFAMMISSLTVVFNSLRLKH